MRLRRYRLLLFLLLRPRVCLPWRTRGLPHFCPEPIECLSVTLGLHYCGFELSPKRGYQNVVSVSGAAFCYKESAASIALLPQ
jgi:hypothetical protein